MFIMFCVVICSYMINRDDFAGLAETGASWSGLNRNNKLMPQWTWTALDSLARSLQTRAVCRCALVMLPGSLGLMAEWSSRTRNEAGGKGGSPKLLWSIHTQFCVCATPEFRSSSCFSLEVAAISSRTGVCPKAQWPSFTLSKVHLQNNLSSHLQLPDGAARLSAAHQDVFSPAEGLSENTVRGNFWTMLPKP